MKPPAAESAVTGMATARMPGVTVAARKPAESVCTVFASVTGSPGTRGERTTTRAIAFAISGCASLVMKLLAIDDFGHASQRTEAASSAWPGGTSLAATRTSVVIAGGGSEA